MMEIRHRGGWVILMSFLIALILTILPLPVWGEFARPEWVALVLVYWCMALPERVGVIAGWLAGLLQDALTGTLLGAHALAFALVAFLALKLHRRIRVLPPWQQAMLVLILLLVVRLVLLWIHGLTGGAETDLRYWLPALTGTLIWPVVFLLLRETRRRYRVQ